MDTLVPGLRVTHQMLVERLDLASVARPTTDPQHPRDQYPAIDTFLASASRHNAATLAVVVPAVRSHVADGTERAHDFVAQSRRFEVALSQVKAKLYGSSYAVRGRGSRSGATYDASSPRPARWSVRWWSTSPPPGVRTTRTGASGSTGPS